MDRIVKLLLEERELLHLLIYFYEVEPYNEAKRDELRETLDKKRKEIERETKEHEELMEFCEKISEKYSKMLEK
jgi:hypothetical protein